MHQYTNTLLHQYISIPIHQYTNTSIHEYTNTQMRQYASSSYRVPSELRRASKHTRLGVSKIKNSSTTPNARYNIQVR